MSSPALELVTSRLLGILGKEHFTHEHFLDIGLVARTVSASPDRLEELAFVLSRKLQAAGVMISERWLCELLPEVAALLDPVEAAEPTAP